MAQTVKYMSITFNSQSVWNNFQIACQLTCKGYTEINVILQNVRSDFVYVCVSKLLSMYLKVRHKAFLMSVLRSRKRFIVCTRVISFPSYRFYCQKTFTMTRILVTNGVKNPNYPENSNTFSIIHNLLFNFKLLKFSQI